MKMTMFREGIRVKPAADGSQIVLHLGDDALPYVDDAIYMVADGIGGDSAARHEEFDRDIFDPEKIMDALFGGVIDYEGEEKLIQYVQDSFADFFASRDFYFDNYYHRRKSAFFGARIASALFLYKLMRDEALHVADSAVFDTLAALPTAAKKQAHLDAMGAQISAFLKKAMRQVAERANFILKNNSSLLFGTTLCATVYRRATDGKSVEVINLVAGDSRPYVITEEGMMQTVADCEGGDGAMTSFVCADADIPLTFTCNYAVFPMPCILFNASDGCFDSGRFNSQLMFEKLILEDIVSSENMDEVSEKLKEFFVVYGVHDDSSTIAMRTLGFGSYEELVAFAEKRLAVIGEEYLSELPELLDRDFGAELRAVEAEIPGKLSSMKGRLGTDAAVIAYCEEQIRNGGSDTYRRRIAEVDEKIAVCRSTVDYAQKQMHRLVERYFIGFAEEMEPGCYADEKTVARVRALYRGICDAQRSFASLIKDYEGRLSVQALYLESELAKVRAVDEPWEYTGFSSVDFVGVCECRKKISDIFSFMESLDQRRNDTLKTINQLLQEFYEKSIKKARGNEVAIEKICAQLLTGEIATVAVDMMEAEEKELILYLDSIRENEEQIHTLQTEEKAKIMADCVPEYWAKHGDRIMQSIVSVGEPAISEELQSEVCALLSEVDEKRVVLTASAAKQAELLAKYEVSYHAAIRLAEAAAEETAEEPAEEIAQETADKPAEAVETPAEDAAEETEAPDAQTADADETGDKA